MSPKNVSLDTALLQRYAEATPGIRSAPSSIFDLGVVRGHYFHTGRIPVDYDLISIDIHARSDLDRVIDPIVNRASKTDRFDVWFRGQPDEYLLDDLRSEALTGICPWRDLRDISQIPSLYRNTAQRLSDLSAYSRRLLEIYLFYLFMKEILGLATYDTRPPGAPEHELFSKSWGQHLPELTTSMSTGGELVEYHDTHVAFRSLQVGLFLQHYGLESNVLDITSDVDVALFFAPHQLVNDRYIDVDRESHTPVIYIFILDRLLDPVVNTSELIQDYEALVAFSHAAFATFGTIDTPSRSYGLDHTLDRGRSVHHRHGYEHANASREPGRRSDTRYQVWYGCNHDCGHGGRRTEDRQPGGGYARARQQRHVPLQHCYK
jgi:hypothetical protein